MAFGPNSILDMGRWALFASQVQLQVTGENISNVETEGYSRRTVRLKEGISIDHSPGQIGTGVQVEQIVRHFDKFIEELYYDKGSDYQKWEELTAHLTSVESLINESGGNGVSDALSMYFNAWNDVSQRPDNYGARESLLNDATTLTQILRTVNDDMTRMQLRMDELITAEVARANVLMGEIADLNKEITIHDVPGQTDANKLFDQRAMKLRELGEIIDINVIDNGAGDLSVLTRSGKTLVDGVSTFELSFEAASKINDFDPSTTFAGDIYFEGSDNFEYTIEFLASGSGTGAGMVSNGSTAAQFRVSLDGGQTWLTDENGFQKTFYARDFDQRVQVQDLSIWFGSATDSKGTPTGSFTAGDRYVINPQKGLYWVENTSHKENITPQNYFTGEQNTERLTGGKLTAMFQFRDYYVGQYKDKLNAMSESLIWETNRRHSQGAGLQKLTELTGTYDVADTSIALGSDSSGLHFNDRLTSGSSFIYIYNVSNGLLTSSSALDFDSATAGVQPFDPDTHTLTDVMNAFNNTFGDHLTASITNNQLHLEANSDKQIAFGTDTSGLMAALGINTLFTGDSAGDISINTAITSDLDLLATGHVNGAGEVNSVDNTTALSMYALRNEDVQISTPAEGTTTQSILEYYNSIVANVGSDLNSAEFNRDFTKALKDDLNERQQSVAGVNLDEEMSNLIRYQHAYTAAAKLISTADQMLQTILQLKP